MINYKDIEKLFSDLIIELENVFSSSEKTEVKEFIDVGEYGLALETLVDIIFEENKFITEKSLNLIHELIEIMNLEKKVFESKLSKS